MGRDGEIPRQMFYYLSNCTKRIENKEERRLLPNLKEATLLEISRADFHFEICPSFLRNSKMDLIEIKNATILICPLPILSIDNFNHVNRIFDSRKSSPMKLKKTSIRSLPN